MMMTTDWITCNDCIEYDGDVLPCHRHTREHYVVEMSRTKAAERIRRAARLVRDRRGYPMNWRTEVGTRLVPVFADTEDDARRRQQVTMAAGSVDDLDESGSIDEMVWVTQCRGVGYVVHLYFYSLGDWGELEDVVTVWTGTDDDEPVILN